MSSILVTGGQIDMEIRPLTGTLGAEIFGADITKAGDFQQIHDAFVEYSVITIRDQKIAPEDHLAFAQKFGAINVNRFFKKLETHPEIAIVLKEKDQQEAIGEEWHTDHSYDQIPAMGSILHAIEVPPHGGDTAFVSMAAVFAAFSEPMKTFLRGLQAWHSSRHAFGETQQDSESSQTGRIENAHLATQDALHPVIIRHPLSGREGVYVNPDFTTHIDGLTQNESDHILQMIYEVCQRPEYQARISWSVGDVTMWDNRATWHKAINDYAGHRRYMHRVTVEGCALHGTATNIRKQG